MDVDEELRKSARTGEVVLGSNETLEAAKSGEPELITVSVTCPRDVEAKIREYSEKNEIPVYYYEGGGKELGLALGKPFSVAVMAVLDAGDSTILEIGEVTHGD
ncbi:hypothetical protein AKJ62_02555 [candidate division MSBL1 archaeon SCGC-AAA259D14]|uniref:Large ribosomal subunit protein eL30 n=1 Tax=candidate division MSBL1 archaeon SCGC-AAA259D14 TaxID=1698261 RepID=A0A133U670_9EURY|nr:hypothetical protein AKJ62_02555 [candidate division MSBL1 archaeon SCGC-AAA259D14]